MSPALPDIESLGSLYGLFKHRLHHSPDETAYLRYDEWNQNWRTIPWREVGSWLSRWIAALEKEPLNPGDRVGIALRNSIEWVLADQAAAALGLVSVPLFVDDRAESMAYILDHAAVKLLFMTDAAHFDRLLPALSSYHSLERVVTLDGESESALQMPLQEWLPPQTDLTLPADDRTDLDALATIVYTSGTTGRPKGVCLTHRNILSNVHAALQVFECFPADRLLSFLPLSHMLERTAGYYLPMMAGCCVAHARSIQLLREDMKQVRPTLLIAVPRIFERVYARLDEQLSHAPAWRKKLFDRAIATGWRSFESAQEGRSLSLGDRLLFPLLDRLVGRKVREALGGEMRAAFCGGAPLPTAVAQRFIALGVPIMQGYGLTESAPVASVNTPGANRPSTVGRALPGVEAQLGKEDELLIRGPLVMQGYHRDSNATKSAIDPGGWLHTGDQALIDADGFITITGRIKDILVLSNGEKVSPGDIESTLKLDPLIEEAVVFGEGQPFIGALLALNSDLWPSLAKKLGLDEHAPKSLESPAAKRFMIRHANTLLEGFAAYAKIRRVVLTQEDWGIESGELTPTLKVKRKVILDRFAEAIDTVYKERL
jgi:long-chain acyl-CoA synthetase